MAGKKNATDDLQPLSAAPPTQANEAQQLNQDAVMPPIQAVPDPVAPLTQLQQAALRRKLKTKYH